MPTPTLVLSLNPAAKSTRGTYAQRMRPFNAGSAIIAQTLGDADGGRLVGVNFPGSIPGKKLTRIMGRGRAASATPVSGCTYTTVAGDIALASGANALPSSDDAAIEADAAVYANAICVIYDAMNKSETLTLLPRAGLGLVDGSAPTSAFWRVDVTTAGSEAITICSAYATGPLWSDLPKGWVAEVIVPDSADIITTDLVTSVSRAGVAYDFMFAGTTAKAGIVNIIPARQ